MSFSKTPELYYFGEKQKIVNSRYDRERPNYDRNYDRGYYERGNGYDNLDSRYPYESRGDRYNVPIRRPSYEEPAYVSRYDYRGRRPEVGYDRYDPYERHYNRRPIEDRYYDRFGSRGSGGDVRGSGTATGGGYYSSSSSGNWGPGYDRGYASSWNYAPARDRDRDRDRDSWRDRDFNRDRDYNRDRDPG